MAEVNAAQPKKKGSFARAARRLSTKVDLTPMVDLGFLLITFFVLTSSMSEPRVMTLFETADGVPKPVKQSGAMTILLGADHKLFYYHGIFDKTQPHDLQETDFRNLRSLILEKKRTTAIGDLMYLIKAGKNSSFGDHVNLLDEMAICSVPSGHFAEVDMTNAENESMSAASNRGNSIR